MGHFLHRYRKKLPEGQHIGNSIPYLKEVFQCSQIYLNSMLVFILNINDIESDNKGIYIYIYIPGYMLYQCISYSHKCIQYGDIIYTFFKIYTHNGNIMGMQYCYELNTFIWGAWVCLLKLRIGPKIWQLLSEEKYFVNHFVFLGTILSDKPFVEQLC